MQEQQFSSDPAVATDARLSDEQERSKLYNAVNVLLPERLEFETFSMYKHRQKYMKKNIKNKLRGTMFFVSKVTVPMYEKDEESKEVKTDKTETFTQTFRHKDHPELKRKTFKEQKANEEDTNQDNQ